MKELKILQYQNKGNSSFFSNPFTVNHFLCSLFYLKSVNIFPFIIFILSMYYEKTSKLSHIFTDFLNHVPVSFELQNPTSKIFDMKF